MNKTERERGKMTEGLKKVKVRPRLLVITILKPLTGTELMEKTKHSLYSRTF